jgi:hypothetical protein
MPPTPMPTQGVRQLFIPTDQNGNEVAVVLDAVSGLYRLAVDAVITVAPPPPGGTITSPADTVVGIGATVALAAVPAGTSRMTVQVTDGDSTTRVRIRESGGTAGAGILLSLLGSRVYGGADGALGALEAQNVVGPASAVAVQFED